MSLADFSVVLVGQVWMVNITTATEQQVFHRQMRRRGLKRFGLKTIVYYHTFRLITRIKITLTTIRRTWNGVALLAIVSLTTRQRKESAESQTRQATFNNARKNQLLAEIDILEKRIVSLMSEVKVCNDRIKARKRALKEFK